VENTYLAQSTNYQRNYKATSGAIVKETLRYLFNTNQIQAAIAVQKTGKLKYEPTKIMNIEEIDRLPSSIYHMVDYTNTLKILKESKEKKFVVVGTPWQIDGMYQYIFKKEPKLKNKIVLTIGLLTGWYFTYHTVKALCRFYNLDYNALDNIVYRGNGKSGKTRLIFENGKQKIFERFTFKSLVAFERYFNVPKFLIEVNTQNMLADLVVGDAHTKDCAYSKTGISLVIARSKKADEILNKMKKRDKIRLLKTDNEHVVRSQKRDRLYGDFAWSYMKYLNKIGEFSPEILAPSKNHYKSIAEAELEKFHRILKRRRKLLSEGKYWQIFIEKYSFQSFGLYKKLICQVLEKIGLIIFPRNLFNRNNYHDKEIREIFI
jgi:coenzyme F420-reducing hydrogenase beta subunit